MKIVPLERMTVPPRRMRQRIDTAELNRLSESIERLGLLHPIVVRPLQDQLGNPIYQLVCGERRYRAVQNLNGKPIKCHGQELPPEHIAVTFLSDLSDLARKEAEYEENILRVDLSDMEKDLAIAGLHSLRQSQHPQQTQQDTAKEIAAVTGQSVPAANAAVSRAIIIARHADDPEIKSARNSNERYAIITRRYQARFEAKLAKAEGQVSPHIFIQDDLRHALPLLARESVDCIIADPPYGISADDFGSAGASHTYEDSPEVSMEIATAIIREGMYAAKPSSHIYLFCDIEQFLILRGLARSSGWSVQRTPIIWYKSGVGFDPHPGIGFKRSYEILLYGWKGDKPARALIEDVIEVRGAPREGHAAAKPVDLYRRLLDRSCIPGDSVLDPCCGSGTIFPAATRLALKATGIEVDPHFAILAQGRLTATE